MPAIALAPATLAGPIGKVIVPGVGAGQSGSAKSTSAKKPDTRKASSDAVNPANAFSAVLAAATAPAPRPPPRGCLDHSLGRTQEIDKCREGDAGDALDHPGGRQGVETESSLTPGSGIHSCDHREASAANANRGRAGEAGGGLDSSDAAGATGRELRANSFRSPERFNSRAARHPFGLRAGNRATIHPSRGTRAAGIERGRSFAAERPRRESARDCRGTVRVRCCRQRGRLAVAASP